MNDIYYEILTRGTAFFYMYVCFIHRLGHEIDADRHEGGVNRAVGVEFDLFSTLSP